MARLEHFAIYAADTRALKDFYLGAFDMRVVQEGSGDPPGFFLADGDGMAIEIIGRPPGAPVVSQRWVCHLAFQVDDFPSAHEALQARGIVFESDTLVKDANLETAFFNDPEGNRCQIVKRARRLGT